MEYKTLRILFHQDETQWKTFYETLFSFPFSRHIDIPIQPYGSTMPPAPAFFYYTDEIVQRMEEIGRGFGYLTDTLLSLPGAAIHQFTRNCFIEEIQSSNEIEGVRSTRKEISLAMDEQGTASPSERIRLWGVVNKYNKLLRREEIPFRTCEDLRAFYDEFILDEVRDAEPKNIPDGKLFRSGSVDVVSAKGKVLHRGAWPEAKIIQYMDTALAFLHNEEVAALIRLAAFHYLFGYIHPFYDGNGRTSRFITSYGLAKLFHPLVGIRLSLTIRQALRTYYKLFEVTNDYGSRGDLTPFIGGFLGIISKSITRTDELLREKKQRLDEAAERLHRIVTDKKDYRIYYVLLQAALFSQEGASLTELSEALNLHGRTLRRKFEAWPQDHILVNREARQHRYRLNLDLLNV